ncbi:MAG: carboxy terminal-processing peptidase, partial [Polyangiaceae bacterium]
PLPWDTVAPASYDHLGLVRPYLAELRRRSARRIASDRDFAYLAADVARTRHELNTRSVSLNEAQRRREMAQDQAQRAAREQHDATLRGPRPITYAITLENASSPGLPAPFAGLSKPVEASKAAGATEPGDLDALANGRSWTDEVVLGEALHILADYVELRAPVTGRQVEARRAVGHAST